jgi:acyl carrier protein
MDDSFLAILRVRLKYVTGATIEPEARLRDLGLDSLQVIELLLALEDMYGVILPDDKLTDLTFETAGSLWAVIAELREPHAQGTR